ILDAIRATRLVSASNTNLGTILLLAPLAAVPREQPLGEGVAQVLARLTAEDSHNVYQAIRLAAPGGLGRVAEADVHSDRPPDDLLAAMRLAADRDLVARQYASGFGQVLGTVVPWLIEALADKLTIGAAIVHVQMRLMSTLPDSLIARKCGLAAAVRSAAWAAKVLASGTPSSEPYQYELAELDFWLRSDGHRRNPGTTADLLAAGLFAGLRDGWMPLPPGAAAG
ncbi:MAG TPA: triphosphoribosyl-dephospho-CoA synthase, partial [Pirellulales bacterium]|nr:triphosphoribosyl-dephospho-CoA synthase [Pirellulales bacterium]